MQNEIWPILTRFIDLVFVMDCSLHFGLSETENKNNNIWTEACHSYILSRLHIDRIYSLQRIADNCIKEQIVNLNNFRIFNNNLWKSLDRTHIRNPFHLLLQIEYKRNKQLI